MDVERVWVLMAKQKAGEATKEELSELNELMVSLQGNVGNEVFDEIWQSPLQYLPEMKPGDALWNNINKSINTHKPKKLFITKTIATWAAAAAVIAIAAGLFFVNKWQRTNVAQPVAKVINTKPATKTHIVLPDGTQVWLNSNSELHYTAENFGKKYREVNLVGEAFFDVTKNVAHPFIIHAAAVNITVKGTAFNVKAYPKQKHVETSLIRGLVEITTQYDTERKILLRPDEKIIIAADEASYKNNTKAGKDDNESLFTITRLQKDAHDVLPETVWMNKQLSFDNEALQDLVPKLESWFSVVIHVEDAAMKTKRFSGVITTETLKQTLEALKLSSAFTYNIKNDEVWIYSNH